MASVYTNMFCTFFPQASFRSIHEVEVRNKYIIKDFEWCGGKCYEPDRSVSFFLFFGGIWLEVTLQGLLVFFHIAANFWCKGTIKWKLFNLQNNSFGILCFEISISSEEKTALEPVFIALCLFSFLFWTILFSKLKTFLSLSSLFSAKKKKSSVHQTKNMTKNHLNV